MKKILTVCLALMIFGLVKIDVARADEASLLKEAAKELTAKQASATSARQKACFKNALEALSAAQDALADGDEEQAKKMKKKALRWVVQAVRECADPGKAPGQIGEALKEEGAMSENALNRFNDLLEVRRLPKLLGIR